MPASIQIDLCRQQLQLLQAGTAVRVFTISSSRFGIGERSGSLCTPRGRHVIRAKIGAGLPAGACFAARRYTGETWTPDLARQEPGRDWVLTRILWLSGCEPGRNRLGPVDTMRRYIYIHGTPNTEPMGVPFSHGCIRMQNTDVIELFDLVEVGTTVDIHAGLL